MGAFNLLSEIWRCVMECLPRQKFTKEFGERLEGSHSVPKW